MTVTSILKIIKYETIILTININFFALYLELAFILNMKIKNKKYSKL